MKGIGSKVSGSVLRDWSLEERAEREPMEGKNSGVLKGVFLS